MLGLQSARHCLAGHSYKRTPGRSGVILQASVAIGLILVGRGSTAQQQPPLPAGDWQQVYDRFTKQTEDLIKAVAADSNVQNNLKETQRRISFYFRISAQDLMASNSERLISLIDGLKGNRMESLVDEVT